MRTFLLIMTIVGGLLGLAAAIWVAELSTQDRWLKRNLYRLGDEYQRELTLHSRAYQVYLDQRAERDRRAERRGSLTGEQNEPVGPRWIQSRAFPC